jgi:hypothetical protein
MEFPLFSFISLSFYIKSRTFNERTVVPKLRKSLPFQELLKGELNVRRF